MISSNPASSRSAIRFRQPFNGLKLIREKIGPGYRKGDQHGHRKRVASQILVTQFVTFLAPDRRNPIGYPGGCFPTRRPHGRHINGDFLFRRLHPQPDGIQSKGLPFKAVSFAVGQVTNDGQAFLNGLFMLALSRPFPENGQSPCRGKGSIALGLNV